MNQDFIMQMVPLVPDTSLLCFSQLQKKFFVFQNKTFFIRGKYCRLPLYLRLKEPH